jgi:antitoxin (DNA-binding transcriptional repressor) of toxin-antitoxin stability system
MMETRTIDLKDATFGLGELLTQVAEGVEILLVEGDTPLARLVPVQPPRQAGLGAGAIQVSEDFDDPLPDEFWMGDQ